MSAIGTGCQRWSANMAGKSRRVLGIGKVLVAMASLAITAQANAQNVIHRYVTMPLDVSSIVKHGGSGQSYAEFQSGVSEQFLATRPNRLDRLIIHVQFLDPVQKKPQYLVLRDLGRGFLNAKGWQSFRSVLYLNAGGITARYNSAWSVPFGNPASVGNAAAYTQTVSASPVAQSYIAFDMTDDSLAIHEMTVEYNFSFPEDPLEISEGAAFDRISFTLQADDISILEAPAVQLYFGPRSIGGQDLDLDGDGAIDRGAISTASNISQHYKLIVYGPRGAQPSPSDFAYLDALGTGFEFDPDGELRDSGCADGTCDGIASVSFPEGVRCSAVSPTLGDPAPRRKAPGTLPFLLQIEQLPVGDCVWAIYARIGPKTAKGLCESVTMVSGEIAVNQVALNRGLKIFDRISGGVLSNPQQVWLRPIGCP